MKPHLLLTAWAFPPARTSGVHRAAGLARAFVAGGWDVTVLTAPRETFARQALIDESAAAGLATAVRIVEVPFASQAYDLDVSEWSWMRARQPELWNGLRLTRERRSFPEPGFGLWRRELERAAENVHRERAVDLALGTANPHVDFTPGHHLKQRFGVPTVMDFRDAWTVDVFSGNDRTDASEAERKVERELLLSADRVWFVNEPIRRWHAERHPSVSERMRVVSNGFDLVDGRSPAVPYRRIDAEAGLTFGYVGTINFGQFPAEALFAGWSLARSQDQLMARSRLILRGHLGRTGVASPQLQSLLDAASIDDVVYRGPVAKSDLADTYAQFDALVLALASGPGVTSGKVFEFAATGLPVVSVHDPDSAATDIMRTSPAWEASTSLEAQDIADAFIRTARRAREQSPAERDATIAWGAQWERGAQLAEGVRELTAFVNERKSK
ncbi:glycosyltransferase [Microbacterium esteraromaticum]|uniref:Glycosyltransferase n=1 Tax=Microbacterium esteraromaticum TaxID=57043 RepID=A0A939DWU0_9MICO|nr:glycosyltransferase [Microbacterium esteraromaticum]MBN8205697.1 glycosyltransferase [Microbacterium esteraromaticum]MBN8415851.1 glycosyltransferase [Microbacterium esteraromaticum]